MDNTLIGVLMWSFSSAWLARTSSVSSIWILRHTTGGGSVWAQRKLMYLTGQGNLERAVKTSVEPLLNQSTCQTQSWLFSSWAVGLLEVLSPPPCLLFPELPRPSAFRGTGIFNLWLLVMWRFIGCGISKLGDSALAEYSLFCQRLFSVPA